MPPTENLKFYKNDIFEVFSRFYQKYYEQSIDQPYKKSCSMALLKIKD